MQEIQEFLEDLPPDASKIKVKLGSTRTRLKSLHVFDPIPADHEIEDRLIGAGYGDPHEFAQLIALDESGKQLKARSMTMHIRPDHQQESELRIIAEEFRLLMAESRRMIQVNNDLQLHLCDTNRELTNMNMKLRENIFESETESVALKLAMQQVEEEGANDIKREGIQAILRLAEAWQSQSSNKEKAINEVMDNATADQLAELFKTRPDLMDEALDHSDLVTMFTAGLIAKEVGNADG
jgi:hypothetical protein